MANSISRNATQPDSLVSTDADCPAGSGTPGSVTLVGVQLPQEPNATHGYVRWTFSAKYNDGVNLYNLRRTYECYWDRQPLSAPTWQVTDVSLPSPVYDDTFLNINLYSTVNSLFETYVANGSGGWYLGDGTGSGNPGDLLCVDLQGNPDFGHCDFCLSSYEEHPVTDT